MPGVINMTRLMLKKNDLCVIYLTETTVKGIDFISSKTKESFVEPIRDMELHIQIENSSLFELRAQNEEDNDVENLPKEIDSVRLLLNFAISHHNSKYSYLDGELELVDAFTGINSLFSFKNLFVLKFEERFSAKEKVTYIRILLRERRS